MNYQDDEIADAVDILRALVREVEPFGPDLAAWTGDGAEMTDAESLTVAARLVLAAGSERVR